MDAVKVPLTNISRTINKISIELSVNRDILVIITVCVWCMNASYMCYWRQSEKVEHGGATTNLPLSNGIKIISVLQCLHGEIGRTNSDVQKRDGQTKRDSTQLNFIKTYLQLKS